MSDIRSQFLGLNDDVAYLDNASTTQMLRAAHDAMTAYVAGGRANVGRGLYPLAERSMHALEHARKTIADFVDADPKSTIFTKSTTEGLNAIAFGLRSLLKSGDEILVSPFEHHANLLPWRRLARETGATIRTMPMTSDFMLDIDGTIAMISDRTKVIAMTMVSNVTGTILPVKRIIDVARQVATPPPYKGGDRGAVCILDAAQAAPHIPISLRDLGADAIVFGSHKCYGPSGIGAMTLSPRLASMLEPMIVGGGMVDAVSIDAESWRDAPMKFEGGSVNVEGAVGFAGALRWIKNSGHLREGGDPLIRVLRQQIVDGLRSIDGVTVLNPSDAIAIVSFTVDGMHPHDIADLLGQRGICVRAGSHCAQPLIDRIASNGGTVRVSLAAYSTEAEVRRFLDELPRVTEALK